MAADLFQFRGESVGRLGPIERLPVFAQVVERYQQCVAVRERVKGELAIFRTQTFDSIRPTEMLVLQRPGQCEHHGNLIRVSTPLTSQRLAEPCRLRGDRQPFAAGFVYGQPLQPRKFHHRLGKIDGFSKKTDAFISAGDLRQRLTAKIVRDIRARKSRESGLIWLLLERQRANLADSLLELGKREGGCGVEPLRFRTGASGEQPWENCG